MSDKNVKTGVEVEVIGLPGDPKKKYRTKWSPTPNAINPVWNEDPFVFEKVFTAKTQTRCMTTSLDLMCLLLFFVGLRSCFQKWPL